MKVSELIHHKLTSPTVVEIICFLERDDKAAIVMPHYTSSVSEALVCGPLSDHLLSNIAVCGLATCQAFVLAEYSHGDIKPGNMMMTATGTIICIDLETSAAFGEEIKGYTNGYMNTLENFKANKLLDMHLLASVFIKIAQPKLLEEVEGPVDALAKLGALGPQSTLLELAVDLAKVLLRSESPEDASKGVWNLVKDIPNVVQFSSVWPTVKD
jgi:hypothetical protein